MVEGLISLAVIVVGVALSIALHEVGHFTFAKRFGVKVTQFMVGFGPTVWSRSKGETEYGLKAIPLGGYVRMIGMFPPRPARPGQQEPAGRMAQLIDQARRDSAQEVTPADADRVFYRLTPRKKAVVMLGGPVMNLLIASVLLGGVLTLHGTNQVVPVVGAVASCVPSTTPTLSDINPACLPGDPASPAKLAGLQVGDRVVSVDGKAIDTWDELQQAIRAHGASPMTFVVDRAGRQVTLTADLARWTGPAIDAAGNVVTSGGALVTTTTSFLGMTPSVEAVRQPLSSVPGVIWQGTTQMAGVIVRIPQEIVSVAKSVFDGTPRDSSGLISVVGVGRVGYEVGAAGAGTTGTDWGAVFATDVIIIASLNLALFVFNLVPLLPLDGGHVAGALWEAVKRRWAAMSGRPDPGPVDVAKALPLAYAVSILLITMSVLLVYADIVKPVSL